MDKMCSKCSLLKMFYPLCFNFKRIYYQVFVPTEFEFQVKILNFLSERRENCHLKMSLK